MFMCSDGDGGVCVWGGGGRRRRQSLGVGSATEACMGDPSYYIFILICDQRAQIHIQFLKTTDTVLCEPGLVLVL